VAQHFVQPPRWEWYIVSYFFLAGLAGGSYALGTMLRLWGSRRDEGTARIAFLVAFPLVVVCAVLLTIDLGQPLRFWHMLINTTPGTGGLNFKYWSPISIGSWALSIFGLFTFVSFLEALGYVRPLGRIFEIIGSILALFIASYTGVLLSVSNQPVWSDSYAIGGLFVASALSASAALLSWLTRYRSDAAWAEPTEQRLATADGYFVVLELLMIAAFFTTLSIAGTAGRMLSGTWLILWILVVLSLIPSLLSLAGRRTAPISGMTSAIVVIVGVFLLRFVIIFGAQF
jgi:formate-dependent nitrite reductase membrane component NrfD